ncbi:hypothetical protein PWR63_28105 [Paraburkholderia sp. A2WS-5]|uniref:acyltransferase family protein n=1 Tax=unclassified Paraburkholderia TaxID=2615204 RepID=UPI003B808E54
MTRNGHGDECGHGELCYEFHDNPFGGGWSQKAIGFAISICAQNNLRNRETRIFAPKRVYPMADSIGQWLDVDDHVRAALLSDADIGLCGVMKRRWVVLAVALAVNFAAMYGAPHQRGEEGLALFGVTGFMIWFVSMYLAGVCFYVFRGRIPLRAPFAVCALIVFVAALFATQSVTRAVTPTMGAYLLFYVGQLQSPWLAKLRTRDDLSYGLYLYGWPVTQLISHGLPAIVPLAAFACVTAICVPLTFASWRGVEAPALRLKRTMVSRSGPLVQ